MAEMKVCKKATLYSASYTQDNIWMQEPFLTHNITFENQT